MSVAATRDGLALSAPRRAARQPSALARVLRLEFVVAWRRRSEALASLVFFAVVATALPLGLEVSPALLQQIGPAAVWMATLLAVVLAANRLFAAETQEALLEQWLLSTEPLALVVLARVVAHWLIYCAPLLVLAPVAGLAYGLDTDAVALLGATLALGSPTLVLLGAIGAALTLRVEGAAALLATLVLPLFLPILVFAGAACTGANVAANLSLLGAALLASLSLAPLAIAAALRIAAP